MLTERCNVSAEGMDIAILLGFAMLANIILRFFNRSRNFPAFFTVCAQSPHFLHNTYIFTSFFLYVSCFALHFSYIFENVGLCGILANIFLTDVFHVSVDRFAPHGDISLGNKSPPRHGSGPRI